MQAAGGELGSARLLDAGHYFQMHPAFGVHEGDLVDDGFHHLPGTHYKCMNELNAYDCINCHVEVSVRTSLSMR